MSVINRMLTDLERRGAPAARAPGAPAPTTRSGRRSARRYLPPLALALALVAVAAALWQQRGPELIGWIAPGTGADAGSSAPASTAPRAEAIGGGADAAAAGPDPGPSEPAPQVARLERVTFVPQGERGVALRLALAGEPTGRPEYSRDGERVVLRLPARADGVALPAPPGGQDVFRALRLQPDADAATLTLEVHPDARFDVATAASGFVLRGALPASGGEATTAEAGAPARPEGQAESGDGGTATAAGDDPDAGTRTARADDADADNAPGGRTGTVGDDAGTVAAAEPADQPGGAAAPDGRADGGPDAGADGAGDGARTATVRKSGTSTPALRATRRYREAREALADGEHAVAREHLRAALDLDGGLHPARELLVALLRRTGRDAAARNVLAEGVERAPGRVSFAKPYARLLVDAGELGRAAAVLERAAAGGARDPGYHALRAAIAQRLGRHERAIDAYTRALELDGGRGRWWLGLGISLAAADYPDEARAAFREARATGDLDQRLDGWAKDRIAALDSGGGS